MMVRFLNRASADVNGHDPMIFRSRKPRESTIAVQDPGNGHPLDREGDRELDSVEEIFERIDALSQTNRTARNPQIESRLLELRHRAGVKLTGRSPAELDYSPPDFDRLPNGSGVPEVAPGELTPGLLRAAILRRGCLLIRGFLDPGQSNRLLQGVERAFEMRASPDSTESGNGAYYREFEPTPQFDLESERGWVNRDTGGLWGADSPTVMFDMLDAFEKNGLRGLATDYLGERPAVAVNKCTLRRVKPETGGGYSLWHQDGAFMGDVRALNVWVSLSRCGDVAPGLDIVPRRIEQVLPTGTEGALFDWSVSPAVVEEAAGDVAITRPIFEPGDVLLFDELCLHSTAAEPEMPNTRYAIESWFFGPSGFPADYAPLAV
jgi:hypothetical protein